MLAVALAMFGVLAVMLTEPAATPVTGTATLVAPTPTVTVAGVVATVGSLDVRVTANPAEAGTDRFKVRFWVEAGVIVRLAGQKLIEVAVVVPPEVT
jgi:hypothetical protein